MNDIKGGILWLLENTTTVKRPELLRYLHNCGHDINDRQMRKSIEDMVENDGHLIQSSEAGYSMIRTPEQFEAAKKYLSKKSKALLMREFFLTRNWKTHTGRLFAAN